LLDVTSATVENASADDQRSGSSDAGGPCIRIDYSKTVAAVYTDVARYVIQTDSSLKLLYMNATFGLLSPSNLPSWVPDWSKGDRGGPWYSFASDIAVKLGESAVTQGWRCMDWAQDTYVNSQIGGYGNSLTIRGFVFRHISKFTRGKRRHSQLLQANNVYIASCCRFEAFHDDGPKVKALVLGDFSIASASPLPLFSSKVWRDLSLDVEQAFWTSAESAGALPSAPPESWLVPKETCVGDVVGYFDGSLIPFVLRSVPGSDQWNLLGKSVLQSSLRGPFHLDTDVYCMLCRRLVERLKRHKLATFELV